MSYSVEVPQYTADHVQEVKAAHAPSLPPLSSFSWEDRYYYSYVTEFFSDSSKVTYGISSQRREN